MKIKSRVLFLCVLGSVCLESANAGVGTWTNFTSMKDVKSLARNGIVYWAATSGGLFSWEEGSSTFSQFTNAEGLQNIDLTSVTIDKNGTIWTGTSTGVLHAYTPERGTWRYVLDIAGAGQTNKKINSLTIHGDTLLICTEFGLSVFRNDKFQFGDTYSKFGSLTGNVRVSVYSATIHDGRIWAAVSDGQSTNRIAVGSLSNPNLLPPESWTLQTVGTNTDTPKTLTVFNNRLYVGTTAGLYFLNGTNWTPISELTNKRIIAATSSSNLLGICTADSAVYTIDRLNNVQQLSLKTPRPPTSIALSQNEQPVVGSLDGGILTLNTTWSEHLPNGPASNAFLSVAIDPNGHVWAASGQDHGSGFYRFNGTEWKSFTRDNSPIPTNDFYRVAVACDGSVWASSWGGGVVEIPAGADNVDSTHVYGINVGLSSVPEGPNYVVTSAVACDSRGNTWVSIFKPSNSHSIAVRDATGRWRTSRVLVNDVPIIYLFDKPVDRSLVVDAFDNLWAIVRQDAYKGIISFGNRGGFDSVATVHLTSNNGLPSNDVNTIIVDRNNDIWVGTERGIAIILDPSDPTRTGGIAAYRPLNGLIVNTIAVDPLNQKWIGTNEGAILLSGDGTQQLASYTVENTGGKLIDNIIRSIAIDPKTGTVYFGTANGLASLTTAAAEPKTSFDELLISPNPFIIPHANQLTIDGLIENSSLKILSIDGRLIRQLQTPGGRIGFWDGKSDEGKDVSSGIYLIVAYSEDGSKVAKTKVAVIRR
ncbi:MAG: hypothetical protein HY708_08215 [Ignavibacteriae bacterium]|nr:hypothetical protein [Ignavibacteriota bacterium]